MKSNIHVCCPTSLLLRKIAKTHNRFGRTINQTFYYGYRGSKYTSKKRQLLVPNKSENRVRFPAPMRMVTDATCGHLMGGTGDIASATDTCKGIDLAGHLGKLESATHTHMLFT